VHSQFNSFSVLKVNARIVRFLLIVCIAVTGKGQLHAQNSSPVPNSHQVMLTATVRNKAGSFIAGLPREAFKLFDEKDERPVAFFENADSPWSIGIVVDNSSSMHLHEARAVGRPGPIGEAVSRFVELSNPDDEYFVMTFDTASQLAADWTSSKALLNSRFSLVNQGKNTALYDACLKAIEKLQAAHHARRALLLFSDGQDNASHSTFVQLRESLKRSDIYFEAIGLQTPSDVGSTLGMEGQGVLAELAEITGGEVLLPENNKKLSEAIEYLSNELRHQYRLGFLTDPSANAEKWRRLKIKVIPPAGSREEFKNLAVRSRSGYYSR